MKKQTKKLTLNKKTISNLTATEMSKLVGATSCGCSDYCTNHACGASKNCTQNQNTCPGHASCYTC